MTVAALPSTASYVEDGVTTSFPVPFRFKSASDLVVERIAGGVATALSLGVDYAVTGGSTDAGGTLTRTAPTAGATLRITRRTARAQPMVYSSNDRFPAKSHEEALDRGMLIAQELDAAVADLDGRALLVPLGEAATPLPSAAARAGRAIVGLPGGGFGVAALGDGDDPALRPELAADDGASRIGTAPGWTTAPGRPQSSVNNDRASIFDVLSSPLQQARIRAGTSDYDASPDFVKATQAAAAERRELFVPAGRFLTVPGTPKFDEDNNGNPAPSARGAIRMVSGMRLRGEPGATLVLPTGSSTDANPRSLALLYTNAQISDVVISGMTFDLNAAGNPISPDRAAGTYNRFNMAAIEVSGTPGGVAAKIDNMHIERSVFRNCPGVCMLVCGQSNTPGAALGRGWRLLHNEFLEHGLDSDDGTAVFGWVDDMIAIGNRFANSQPFGTVGRTGGNTGYEIHGADHRLLGNEFINYIRGIWVSSNLTSEVRRSIIAHNIFRVLFYGVDFFRTTPSLSEIVDTIVSNNQFFFDDTAIAAVPGLNFKAAVQVASEYRQREIDVSGNRAYKTGSSIASAFAVVTNGDPTAPHTAININDNSGRGLTIGTFVRTSATAGLGLVDVRGNRWHNLTPAAGFAASGDAIERTGTTLRTIDQLIVGGGACVDDRGSPALGVGVRINTGVVRLDRLPTVVRNATIADWQEDGGADVANRTGFYEVRQSYDPASLADGATANLAVPAVGAAPGDTVTVAFTADLAGVDLTAWVAAAGSITVRFANRTGAAVDLPAGQLRVRYGKGQ